MHDARGPRRRDGWTTCIASGASGAFLLGTAMTHPFPRPFVPCLRTGFTPSFRGGGQVRMLVLCLGLNGSPMALLLEDSYCGFGDCSVCYERVLVDIVR
jgi:hypothetical protein